MHEYNLAMLVHLVQTGDQKTSQDALAEIRRRGFEYEDLHEEFNR